jgi:hypothetical protein
VSVAAITDFRQASGSFDETFGVRVTAVGAFLPDTLSFEEWLSIGRRLIRAREASAWWIGDWLAYGEWRYGTKYRTVLDRLELSYDRARDYAYVAGNIAPKLRRPDLSFRHHRVVAKLPPGEQREWLARAALAHWTTREFIAALAGSAESAPGAEEPEDTTDAKPAELRLSIGRTQLEGWRRAAAARGLELREWAIVMLDDASTPAGGAGCL